MSEVKKTILIEHSATRMFDLVDKVEDYPRFLPWCDGTLVSQRTDTVTVATLNINYHGIKSHFTTENTKQRPTLMRLQLREGPFKQLEGEWRFTALGESACKIEFRLNYDFSSRLLEKALGPVFNHIATTFVDAFVKRAEQVFGARAG